MESGAVIIKNVFKIFFSIISMLRVGLSNIFNFFWRICNKVNAKNDSGQIESGLKCVTRIPLMDSPYMVRMGPSREVMRSN